MLYIKNEYLKEFEFFEVAIKISTVNNDSAYDFLWWKIKQDRLSIQFMPITIFNKNEKHISGTLI